MDILNGLIRFCDVMSQLFGISKELTCFLMGCGFATFVGLVGRVAFRVGVWRSTRDAAYSPQTAVTAQTPYQVMRASRQAGFRLLLFWLSLFTIACILIYILANTSEPTNLFAQLMNALFRSLLPP